MYNIRCDTKCSLRRTKPIQRQTYIGLHCAFIIYMHHWSKFASALFGATLLPSCADPLPYTDVVDIGKGIKGVFLNGVFILFFSSQHGKLKLS